MTSTQLKIMAWGSPVTVERKTIPGVDMVFLSGPAGDARVAADGSVVFSAVTHTKDFTYQAGTGEDMAARLCARGVERRGACL